MRRIVFSFFFFRRLQPALFFSFPNQPNRDKISTRKFDVGVFTQPGPGTEVNPAGEFPWQQAERSRAAAPFGLGSAISGTKFGFRRRDHKYRLQSSFLSQSPNIHALLFDARSDAVALVLTIHRSDGWSCFSRDASVTFQPPPLDTAPLIRAPEGL